MKKLPMILIKALAVIAFLLPATLADAQNFTLSMKNVTQTSPTVLEFDMYLLNTYSPAQTFELGSIQFGFLFNSNIYSGGTVTVAYSNTGSGLTAAQQFNSVPNVSSGLSGYPNQTLVKLAGRTTVGSGNGSLISAVAPGTLVTHFTITSTVSFTVGSTPDLAFCSSTVGNPLYPTRVSEYIATVNTALTVIAGTNAIVDSNPVLNPPVSAPAVFAMTGGGTYCQGSGGLPVGLAGSEVGVTYTLFLNSVATTPTFPGTGSALSFGTLTAGTYTASGTNIISSTSMTGSAVLTETPMPAATISYPGSPFCTSVATPQAVSLTGTTGGTYSAAPAGLTINASTGAVTPGTSTAGAYTVTYTIAAAGGCSQVTATAPVTITTAPAATISYPGSPYCTSLSAPQAVSLTGTTGGTYSAAPAGLTINGATGAITPSTSTAGSYTVTYTIAAANGCQLFTTTAGVTITASPAASISYPGSPFCFSVATPQTVTLTGTTGGTFTAAPAGLTINASTGAVTPSTSTVGVYTVTYTIAAANGCSQVTATAPVTVTATPSATISYPGSPFCTSLGASQAVSLTGTPGGTFSAAPGGLTINASTGAITPSSSTAGSYTVTYTIAAAGGCLQATATAGVTITTAPTAGISYAGSPFCKSVATPQNVTFSGTTGGTYSAAPAGLTINASTGAVTPSTSTAGSYTVTYTIAAANGCGQITATAGVVITTAPSATIAYSGSPYCTSIVAPQAVTLTGSTGGTFSALPAGLSLNASTGAITPSTSTAGSYTVTYTIAAAGGCQTFTTTAGLTITAAPTAGISYAGTPYCKSVATPQNVTLTGTTGGTYTATPAGLTINASTGAVTPSTSTAGTYSVTYTIAAAGGCNQVTASAPVTITTAPSATISYAGSPFCTSVASQQSVTFTGTTGGTFTAAPAGLSINALNGAITPGTSTAGTYTVTYTIAAAGGCSQFTTTAGVTITAAPSATISYAGTPFCNSIAASQAVTVTGTLGGTFSAAPAGLTINASTGAITPNTSTVGSYTVTYTIAAAGGCAQVTATAGVSIITGPTATISYPGTPFCASTGASQAVSLTGTTGGTFTAAPAGLSINALSGAITPNGSSAGTYVVTYTIAATGGCAQLTTTASVRIDPVSVGGAVIGGVTPILLGQSTGTLSLTGQTGTILKWQKRLGMGAWTDIANTTASYSEIPSSIGFWEYLAVVQSNTCSPANSASVIINVTNPSPGIVAGGTTPICQGVSIGTLTLSGYIGTIVKWQKRVDGGTWTDIANTAATFTENATTPGTWDYRAVVNSGIDLFSGFATIVVNPASVGGSIALNAAQVTYGGSTGIMTLSQQTGTILKWQKSFNNGAWSDISNTTTTYIEVPAAAGSYKYRAVVQSGLCAEAFSAVANLTVMPKELTVTGALAQNKAYDGNNTAQITGGTLTGVILPDVLTLGTATGTFAQTAVGNDIAVSSFFSVSGAASVNYTLIQPAGLRASITPKGILVTPAAGQTRVYGTADPVIAFTMTPTLIGSDVYGGALSRVAGTNAGTYAITMGTLSAGANYNLTLAPVSFTVTPMPITVTAVTTTKTYDGTPASIGIPVITPALVTGDTPVFTQVYNDRTAANNKDLIPSGTVNDGNGGNNYQIHFVNDNNGVINPLTLAVNVIVADKTFDGNTDAVIQSSSLTGVITGDDVTVTGGTASFNTPSVGLNKPVNITGLTLTGTDFLNYRLGSVTTSIANIFGVSVAATVTTNQPAIQYSDQVILTATIAGGAPVGSGLLAAQTVTFTIGGQVMKNASNVSNIPLVKSGTDLVAILMVPLMETTMPGSMTPGDKVVTATFNSPDPSFQFDHSTATAALTITPEDATVSYNGDLLVNAATGGTSTVVLKASINDISAETGGDAWPGDISTATVSFINRRTNAVLGTVPVNLVSSSDPKTGTAIFNWTNAPQGDYVIGIVVNGYYSRNIAADNTVVVVYPAGNTLITGSGLVTTTLSSGRYASDNGKHTNFGFDVRFDEAGNIQNGRATILVRRTTLGAVHVYEIKSTDMTAVAVNIDKPAELTGGFIGIASLTDITDPMSPITVASDQTLKITMCDRGNPGNTDGISITLYSGSVLDYSSNWVSSKTSDMTLAGGNVLIQSPINITNGLLTGIGDIPAGSESGMEILAYPNPSDGIVNFKFNVDVSSMTTLDIMSTNGTLVSRVFEGYVDSSWPKTITYDSKLPQGIYMYKLQTSGRVVYGKIVIDRTFH